MKHPSGQKIFLTLVAAIFSSVMVRAQDLNLIGVTVLRAVVAKNLDGSGIRVAQPEASLSTNSPIWAVNPADTGHPVSIFTYFSADGSTNGYPNSLSANSWHADDVGNYFYGIPNGVSTNVAHVDNYDADFFITNYIFDYVTNYVFVLAPMPAAAVVNQSFTFGNETTNLSAPAGYLTVSDQQEIDLAYDDYAVEYNTLFVSAVNNGGPVSPPGTAYNSIGVAAYGGSSGIGPTLDNGRCKPDITAPAGGTSFSTPQVAGAAALLMQAALRGDGGSDTNSAFDLRTVKALLLNGALKPADWTNSTSSPLDARYGAGVLNVFNAYEQLAGGKHGFNASTTVSIGGAHPPNGEIGTLSVLSGWDFNTNSSSASNDVTTHYYFNATNPAGSFALTATLIWNRQFGQTNINNLGLFLYDCANSNLVTCSTSLVDNLEHIFVPKLTPGRYDLQVWKAGGNFVSTAEPYALAFAFTTTALNITSDGTNAILTWPAYPAGFHLEMTTNLASPRWSTNQFPATIITNGHNYLLLKSTNGPQFFRLHQTP